MRNILILSENNDNTTSEVIEWLHYFDCFNVIRINETEQIEIREINLKKLLSAGVDFIFSTDSGNSIAFNDIAFFWYRRGVLLPEKVTLLLNDSVLKEQLDGFLNLEWNIVKDFVLNLLQEKKSLGNYFRSRINKLKNLLIAKECGLTIPETIISGEKEILSEFKKANSSISKPIGEAMNIGTSETFIRPLTIDVDSMEDRKDNVFPTLMQEKIDKWVELRVFVLYEELYAMAIFSQNNEKTSTDFRNYDFENMNRMVPFQLPDDVKSKILSFMEKTRLDTGSIDLIVSKEREYIFLEVNPAGNIEMVSKPCNYNIEKRIAQRIIEATHEQESRA